MPNKTPPPETEKQCIDCVHLQKEDERNWRCEKFDNGEDAYPLDMNEDQVTFCGIDDCLNYTPMLTVHATEVAIIEPEPTEAELNAARDRRDAKMRSVRLELRQMEDSAREARREANSYKKQISELTLELDRIIETDPKGFLLMEEEERRKNALPLIDLAEAWRQAKIDSLDLPEKDREKLRKHWESCGQVADWLAKDYIDKKEGCNRQDFQDRVRTAIDKISGAESGIQAELEKLEEEDKVAA